MESNFQSNVKACLQDEGAWAYVTHNPLQQGIPDIHAVLNGNAIWLELKYTENFPSLPHPLSPQQSKRLRDIYRAGGCSGVLVGAPEGCCFVEASELSPGATHRVDGDLQPLKTWISKLAKDGSI